MKLHHHAPITTEVHYLQSTNHPPITQEPRHSHLFKIIPFSNPQPQYLRTLTSEIIMMTRQQFMEGIGEFQERIQKCLSIREILDVFLDKMNRKERIGNHLNNQGELRVQKYTQNIEMDKRNQLNSQINTQNLREQPRIPPLEFKGLSNRNIQLQRKDEQIRKIRQQLEIAEQQLQQVSQQLRKMKQRQDQGNQLWKDSEQVRSQSSSVQSQQLVKFITQQENQINILRSNQTFLFAKLQERDAFIETLLEKLQNHQ